MRRFVFILVAALVAATIAAPSAAAAAGTSPRGAVFTQTNDPAGNEVVVWTRFADGSLAPSGSIPTGGLGTGAGLGSQGAVTLSGNGRWLHVVNAGSDSVSTFAVNGASLTLTDVEPSGGTRPVSVTERAGVAYVLNAGGTGNITGFTRDGGNLTMIPGSSRPLSSPAAGAAQVGFSNNGNTLIVTEKATNRIDVFPIDNHGLAGPPTVVVAPGTTPFGFVITANGTLVVSEAASGSASSFRIGPRGGLTVISPAVPTTETAACWFAASESGRFVYTTNAGSDSISGYRVSGQGELTLLDADGVTASTGAGSHPTDEAVTGRYLYSLVAGGVVAFEIEHDGGLMPVDADAGLPATAVGLAAT
jgi:6-phosphogluconolactonase (cycloisomerase 2 family)